MVTAPAPTFEWRLPQGFLSFGADAADPASWAQQATRRLVAGGDSEFERGLEEMVRSCLSAPQQPAAWVAVVAEPRPGKLVLVGSGEVTFGPLLDVEALAAHWAEDYRRDSAQPGEAMLVPSRRAPAVIARDVVLDQSDDGPGRYLERGVIVKSFPRVGVTGMLTFSTPNLVAFEDLTAILKDAVADFEIQAVSRG